MRVTADPRESDPPGDRSNPSERPSKPVARANVPASGVRASSGRVRLPTATEWARALIMRDDWVIIDTETTGLASYDEVIEVAAIDRHGTVLVDTRVCPTVPISEGALRVHNITDESLEGAPGYPQVHERLVATISRVTVVAYNAPFDRRLLQQTARAHDLDFPDVPWECAMQRHREYLRGGRSGGLKGGDHSALGDCLATLRLIREMAG